MLKSILIATTLAFTMLTGAFAADEYGSKDEAVAMVDNALALFEAEGEEATFAAVMDPANTTFHDRDLYVFISDLDGTMVAHGAKAALVGKNLIGLKDQDGVMIIQEMSAIASKGESGWVDYKWPNPVTSKIENKSAFVKPFGDNKVVGVGAYGG